MKVSSSDQGKGYMATIQHNNINKYVDLHSKSISVENDPNIIEAEKNLDNEVSLEN